VQIVVIDPGDVVADHYHRQTNEVFQMLSGGGRMVINGEEFLLHPGDTLTCEANEIHNAANTGDESWQYIVFKTMRFQMTVLGYETSNSLSNSSQRRG